MTFVSDQSHKYNCTPILTFDQPLWWKSVELQQLEPNGSKLKNIVLRLGGFHSEMSFLGSIGHLMGGAGLKEALETIYAETAVPYILNGKAISRATRAHILVAAVLYRLILSSIFNFPQRNDTSSDDSDTHYSNEASSVNDCDELRDAASILNGVLEKSLELQNAANIDVLESISSKLNETISSFSNDRTSNLWLMYLDMIDVLLKFIKSERIGDWKMHLSSLSDMLPYLAASGHNLYTKSLYLYLQLMSNLQTSHPSVFKHFENGLHVVRRSDRFWGGLSNDLVIEQSLMRNLKTPGGLTRGRGMGETQRALWVLAAPACAQISQPMQSFTNVRFSNSDQHVDCSAARQSRDNSDMNSLLEFFQQRPPFAGHTTLTNVASGVTAGNTVNVDCANEIGLSIIKSMEGKNVYEITFKRKEQAVTMDDKVGVKIENDFVKVDPQLLFQRLISAAQGVAPEKELVSIFSFELCTHPPALFDNDGLIRPANKSQLADALWSMTKTHTNCEETDGINVVDGGSLIQRIPWDRGQTYIEIFERYASFIRNHFGIRAVVIFDGYSDTPSTKDTTHMRRSMGRVGAAVHFVPDMNLDMKKEAFLNNAANKQRFIVLLCRYLQDSGIETKQAREDADATIVTTAVEISKHYCVNVIGEDTDLLVLLCHHANVEHNTITFKPNARKNVKILKQWNISELKKCLGQEVCDAILFIHAISGCDTTSRIYSIGKGKALKVFLSDESFRNNAKTFYNASASRDEIASAGEQALLNLYGIKQSASLGG